MQPHQLTGAYHFLMIIWPNFAPANINYRIVCHLKVFPTYRHYTCTGLTCRSAGDDEIMPPQPSSGLWCLHAGRAHVQHSF